ncbi:MAG TPA: polysaccharide deacetylase family protein [Xanthobacteraceae bacterium]|nr:polysaccharide deacetylase family protein [Xanthobacteraceae bacterium]
MVICGLTLFGATVAGAAECPGNPEALGTSRTLVVDPVEHPRLGSMQYQESLPLEDHEIVLTFDDGPLPPRSTRVLDILAHECVKATYFIIGKMAHSYPDMVRRIRDAGHTIGTHSYSHPLTFQRMSLDKAELEVNEGIAAVASALGDGTGPAPFFRIPGLLRAEGVEHYLAFRHVQVWSADFPADDWLRIGPVQVYARALQRIEANHKGILLLHDIHERTVEALPYLLRELKRRGYRIVHVVPAVPDLPKTATDPRQWTIHARQTWPHTPVFAEAEPELPAPSPANFGFDAALTSSAAVHGPTHRPHALLAHGQVSSPMVSTWPRGLEAVPNVPMLLGRPQLPAPSPQSFGYLDAPRSPATRTASFDVVPETTGAGNEIRRLLESLPPEDVPVGGDQQHKNPPPFDSLPPEDAPIDSVPPQPRGPIANAMLPHGAFP